MLLAITGVFTNAYSQKAAPTGNQEGWNKMGETTVNFKTEKDEIYVPVTDKFESLKIKVKDSAIHLSSIEVFYENGETQNITVNFPVKPQGEGRIISLKGKNGTIKKVGFVYGTISDKKDEKATVELWGLKASIAP